MSHLSAKWIEALKKAAARETWIGNKNFNPCCLSGGNYDDAYYGGYEDGWTNLAREILKQLEEN